jgi:hypothetical protein
MTMNFEAEELKIPTVNSIKMLLEPILLRLDNIENRLKSNKTKSKPQKYYRNSDLRTLFGLSPNTILKYRETGVLPYTKLGELYLYDVQVIDEILEENTVKF